MRNHAGPGRRPGEMSALEKAAHHGATVGLALTGLAYAWMRYVLEPPADDPFSVISHPWQPTMLHLHVLLAPVWLVVLGLMLKAHVLSRLRDPARRRGRRSGTVSALLLLPMIASGYLLQTATSEAWRRGLVAVHLAAGIAYFAAYVVHVVLGRRSARRLRLAAREEPGTALDGLDLHLRTGRPAAAAARRRRLSASP